MSVIVGCDCQKLTFLYFDLLCSHRLEGDQVRRRLLLRPFHEHLAKQRHHLQQGRPSPASRRLRRRGRGQSRDGDDPQEAKQGASPSQRRDGADRRAAPEAEVLGKHCMQGRLPSSGAGRGKGRPFYVSSNN